MPLLDELAQPANKPMHNDTMAPARHNGRKDETRLIDDKNKSMAHHHNASGNYPNHTALEKNRRPHVVRETRPRADHDWAVQTTARSGLRWSYWG